LLLGALPCFRLVDHRGTRSCWSNIRGAGCPTSPLPKACMSLIQRYCSDSRPPRRILALPVVPPPRVTATSHAHMHVATIDCCAHLAHSVRSDTKPPEAN
jgi:hypothetical protein